MSSAIRTGGDLNEAFHTLTLCANWRVDGDDDDDDDAASTASTSQSGKRRKCVWTWCDSDSGANARMIFWTRRCGRSDKRVLRQKNLSSAIETNCKCSATSCLKKVFMVLNLSWS